MIDRSTEASKHLFDRPISDPTPHIHRQAGRRVAWGRSIDRDCCCSVRSRRERQAQTMMTAPAPAAARQPLLVLLLLLLLLCHCGRALHADRAGKEDWMRRHVGRVVKAVAAPAAAAVVVASEQGAVAALATDDSDGQIRWRHVLPSSSSSVVDVVVVDEKGGSGGLVLALSREPDQSSSSSSSKGSGGSILHCWAWRLKDGGLQWHAPLPSSLPVSAPAFVGAAGKAVAVADRDGFVSVLDVHKGQLQFEWGEGAAKHFNGGGGVVAVHSSGKGALVVVGEDAYGKAPLAFLLTPPTPDATTSYTFTPLKTHPTISTPSGLESLKGLASLTLHARASDGKPGAILVAESGDSDVNVALLTGACVKGANGPVAGVVGPAVVATEGGGRAPLTLTTDGHITITPLPSNTKTAAAVVGGSVMVAATAEGVGFVGVGGDGTVVGSIDTPALTNGSQQPIRHIWALGPQFALISTAADMLVLVDVSSKSVVWRREEALAGVKAVGFVDFVPAAGAVVDKEVRFGLTKVAVLLCPQSRRLVGVLTSQGGKIVWGRDLDGDDYTLLVTRAAYDHRHHHAHTPELLLVSAARAEAAWVDGMTGEPIGEPLDLGVAKGTPLLTLTLLTPPTDADEGRARVLVVDLTTKRGRVLVGPGQTCEAAGDRPLHYHTLDHATGALTTYRLVPSNENDNTNNAEWPLTSIEMGAAALPADEKVVAVAYPDASEVVASPAHVLGDQALLLKHLNPHTVALASVTTVPATAVANGSSTASPPAVVPTLHITVLDTVSARTLHRLTHFHASGPISLRLVENWLVYSYWNTKAQRSELGSVSYYSGYLDKAALSPFKRPEFKPRISSLDGTEPPPLGLQQSFVFPRPVVTIGATLTARGITSKALLLGFAPGQILSLDRRLLDPRRPVLAPGKKPTNAEMAEGLLPYQPHIPILPTHVLSYNQTVEGLRHIYTAPSKLESTSLVLAVGLDLFFTRVAPSKPFDVLSEEFNHVLVSLVLLAMVAAAWLLGRKARTKRLRDCWA